MVSNSHYVRYYVEFLDEILRHTTKKKLQNNLFTILTSMEMVALS